MKKYPDPFNSQDSPPTYGPSPLTAVMKDLYFLQVLRQADRSYDRRNRDARKRRR